MIRNMVSTAAVAALVLTAACSGGDTEANNMTASVQQEAGAEAPATDSTNLDTQSEMPLAEGDASSGSTRDAPAGAPEPAAAPATPATAGAEPTARSNPRPAAPRSEPKAEPAAEPPAAAPTTPTCTPEHRAAGHC